MDKETALYWKEIIRRVDKGDEEALNLYLEESWRRFRSGLLEIEMNIEEVLNPPKPAPQKDWDGMPPRICEWP